MKVLVATHRTQGDRPDDYMRGVPGELVWIPPDTPADVIEEILAETMTDALSHAAAFPLGALVRRDLDRVYY